MGKFFRAAWEADLAELREQNARLIERNTALVLERNAATEAFEGSKETISDLIAALEDAGEILEMEGCHCTKERVREAITKAKKKGNDHGDQT